MIRYVIAGWLAAVSLLSLLHGPAAAQIPTLPTKIASFDNWSTYVARDQQSCLAVSFPAYTRPSLPGRGNVNLAVIVKRSQTTPELWYYAGYNLYPGYSASLEVPNDIYGLTTHGEKAWVDNSDAQEEITSRLRASSYAIITGNSTAYAQISDTFILRGFSEALDRAIQECSVLARDSVPTALSSPQNKLEDYIPGFLAILGIAGVVLLVMVFFQSVPVASPGSATTESPQRNLLSNAASFSGALTASAQDQRHRPTVPQTSTTELDADRRRAMEQKLADIASKLMVTNVLLLIIAGSVGLLLYKLFFETHAFR